MMKPRTAFLVLLLIAALIVCIIVFTTDIEEALADGQPAPTPTPMVWVIEVVPTPSPTPIASPVPAPTPIPLPELPKYDYPIEDLRCLSRGMWSVCPARPTKATKIAFCELVQNRVDDTSGDFEDSVRGVLQQRGEFMDYDPDAYRSRENNDYADYAMRAWIFATVTGDRSYRTVPASGLFCDFYRLDGWDYIKIYNRAGDVVYDSGKKG